MVSASTNIKLPICISYVQVKLTWDETPHERVTFMARNFSKDEIADQDLAAFLASDTDSDEGSLSKFSLI